MKSRYFDVLGRGGSCDVSSHVQECCDWLGVAGFPTPPQAQHTFRHDHQHTTLYGTAIQTPNTKHFQQALELITQYLSYYQP